MPGRGAAARRLGLLPLAAVVLVGAALRLWNLGADDLWTDEVATLYHASSFGATYRDTHPPLYYLLTYAWLAVAPTGELWLRLPSALMGTLAIVATYGLARAAFDHRTGVAAAGIVALSTMHIWHAQDARMYATLAATSALSSWMLLRLLRNASPANAALYWLATTALAYSHLFGLLTIAAQNVFVLYVAVRDRRLDAGSVARWAGLQLAVVAAVAPWLLFLVSNPGAERVDWVPPVSPASVADAFTQFSSDSAALWGLLSLFAVLGVVAVRPAGAAGRIGLGLTDREGAPLMLALLAVPMLLAYAVSLVAMPLFMPRYLIACSIPFYVLAARGMTGLPLPAARWAAVAAVLVLLGLGVRQYVAEPHKPPWRALVQAVAPRAQPSDLLIFDGHRPDVFDHYAAREGVLTDVRRVWLQEGRRSPSWTARGALAESLDGAGRFWLIQFGADGGSREVNEYVRRDYVVVEDASQPGIRARLFRQRR